MSAGGLTVVWFREDLRLADNAALAWAAERGPVVAVVIDEDPEATGHRPAGKASQWWWNKSVSLLAKSLSDHGVPLLRAAGDPHKLIAGLVERLDAGAISWNRRYAAPLSHVDESIEKNLSAVGRDVRTFAGHLLTEPGQVTTAEGGSYKVFTPFSRRAWSAAEEYVESLIGEDQTSPGKLHGPDKGIDPGDEWTSASHSDHGAMSDHGGDVDDCDHLERHWRPGEKAASAALLRFIDATQPRIDGYVKDRDLPAVAATSRLSPYLRFGEVSVHRIWYEVERAHSQGEVHTEDADTFRTELLWRDFAWHRLHHHPDMALRNMRQEFGYFDWQWDPGPGVLKAWQTGHTGIPLVDAGMRELAATGTMHNRVRMVVASFLTKNLLVHWRRGEEWFWDNLVDADPASNPFNWQWVAGCGDDASPYFRIFNPETQRKKFDPEDTYVSRWVPELGTSRYPEPIVDLKESRQEALDAYQLMRNSRQ